MKKGLRATYDGRTVSMDLADGLAIKWDRLTVTASTYSSVFAERPDVSEELQALIGELLKREVVIACTITMGRKMELTLPDQSPDSRKLLINTRLEQFTTAFQELTGKSLRVRWLTSGGKKSWRHEGGGFLESTWEFIVDVLTQPRSWLDDWW